MSWGVNQITGSEAKSDSSIDKTRIILSKKINGKIHHLYAMKRTPMPEPTEEQLRQAALLVPKIDPRPWENRRIRCMCDDYYDDCDCEYGDEYEWPDYLEDDDDLYGLTSMDTNDLVFIEKPSDDDADSPEYEDRYWY